MEKKKLCLSAAEVSKETGVSLSMIRKLTRSGEIPHIKVGRRILYPVSTIMNWLDRNTIGITVPSKDGVVNG